MTVRTPTVWEARDGSSSVTIDTGTFRVTEASELRVTEASEARANELATFSLKETTAWSES